jgi:hypothetical protein
VHKARVITQLSSPGLFGERCSLESRICDYRSVAVLGVELAFPNLLGSTLEQALTSCRSEKVTHELCQLKPFPSARTCTPSAEHGLYREKPVPRCKSTKPYVCIPVLSTGRRHLV